MLAKDIRYALRQLFKSPGFTLTAVLTLAFGIGATTAIFSIVEGVLLRPLPFPDPSRLMIVGDQIEGADFGGPGVPAPESVAYARGTTSFSSMGAFTQTGHELSGVGEPASINDARLGAGVFTALGISPVMGRVFTQQEDDSKAQVVVLSYQSWRSRFHGDSGVLGRKILLDRRPYEVIGVMPRDFEFPLNPGQLNRSELWIPLSLTQNELVQGAGSWNFQIVARLKPGVTVAQAGQDMEREAKVIQSNFPPAFGSLRIHGAVQSLDENTVGQARPLVRTLFFAVAIVLFIACANLAGLLLVRVIRRRREIAVRLALGARKVLVLRQNLIEALSLSVIGGVLGLLLASITLRVGVSLLPETLPRISSIGLDWKVVGFALLLAILTGFICGIAPAFAASRTGVNDALKEGGRTGSSGSGHARLRSALVVAEMAVALILLAGAGLLLRSFDKLRQVNLGFHADHMLTASFSLTREQYSTQAAVDAFNSNLLSRLRQIPGVQTAGITGTLPATGSQGGNGFVPEGYVSSKPGELNLGFSSSVTGDYFNAAGIPLLRGRVFNDGDREGAPLVCVVNRNLAQHYWPGQDPIGKRLKIGVTESPTPWMTVVGEIGDIKQTAPDQPITAQFYGPASQLRTALGPFGAPDLLVGGGSIVLRTSLQP